MAKEVYQKLNLTSDRFEIEPEITAKILKSGYKIFEMPINTVPRGYDQGKKIKAKDAFLAVFTLITAAGLSLFASDKPDGLEWSYAERPDQHHFETIVSNEDSRIAAVDEFQSKYTPLPDYSIRDAKIGLPTQPAEAAGWTSFAGVAGSILTMCLIWLAAKALRKNRKVKTL